MTFVSLDGLVRATRKSKKTVKKYVDHLETEGWVERHCAGNGHKTFTFAAIPEPVPSEDTAPPVYLEDTAPNSQPVSSDAEPVSWGPKPVPLVHL